MGHDVLHGWVGVVLVLTAVLRASLTSDLSCSSASTSGCGAVLDFTNALTPGLTLHLYNFSDLEKAGTCQRAGQQWSASAPPSCLTSTTLGDCTCKNPECESCIKDKQRADTQTCCGTYTYVYHGQTYYYTDQSLAKPTCCQAQGTDAAGKPASACYCEPNTAGCFNVCPALPTSRVVGGTPVEACGTGTVRFSNVLGSSTFVLCNAVYAYHPSGTDSSGAKLQKPVVLLPKLCKDSIDVLLTLPAMNGSPGPVQVTIGNISFPYKKDEITVTELSNTRYTALTFPSYQGPCLNKPVCTYNAATMASLVDTKHCTVLSFGADSLGATGPVFSGNLNELMAYKVGQLGSCKDGQKDAECFFPVNLSAFSCQGDFGAPVLCPLQTGERVLYGVFGQSTRCDETNKLFPVVPIS